MQYSKVLILNNFGWGGNIVTLTDKRRRDPVLEVRIDKCSPRFQYTIALDQINNNLLFKQFHCMLHLATTAVFVTSTGNYSVSNHQFFAMLNFAIVPITVAGLHHTVRICVIN